MLCTFTHLFNMNILKEQAYKINILVNHGITTLSINFMLHRYDLYALSIIITPEPYCILLVCKASNFLIKSHLNLVL
jgi:hypothetical protein